MLQWDSNKAFPKINFFPWLQSCLLNVFNIRRNKIMLKTTEVSTIYISNLKFLKRKSSRNMRMYREDPVAGRSVVSMHSHRSKVNSTGVRSGNLITMAVLSEVQT